ncbi:MAG: hypothetical protein ABSH12_09610, partial [Endomicrobiales bacterium]
RPQRVRLLFWLSFPCTYLILLSSWKVVDERYLLCVFPFFILTGVYSLIILAFRATYPRLVLLPVIAATILLFVKTIEYDTILSQPDTRLVAYHWITQNIPPGTRMIRTINTPEFTNKDPYAVKVDWFGDILEKTPAEQLAQNFDYVIINSSIERDKAVIQQKLSQQYRLIKVWPHIPSPRFHNPGIALYKKYS